MSEESNGMALASHLRELRKRLIISVVALAIGFAVCYTYSEQLYGLLTKPLLPALPPGQEFLAFTGVIEPFFIYLKVGFAGGVVLASPVILFEVWSFVAPGLYKNEKMWFIAIVLFSLFLFISGALFAYLVVFPFGFKYLLSFANPQLRPILSMDLYFSMAVRFLLAFGFIFQLPLAMLVLARAGIVSARKFMRWWRYAIIVILIVSAILTPPDVFSQVLMAAPLIVLYGLGVIGAFIFGKERPPAEKHVEDEDEDEDEDEEGLDDSGYGGPDEDDVDDFGYGVPGDEDEDDEEGGGEK